MAVTTALGEENTATPSVLGVGTIVWLASELMFFAGLFAAYFTLRSINDSWPPGDVDLPAARTAVATLALVASSVTMHMAVAALRPSSDRAARQRALAWLGVTVLLGVLFLSNQVLEYAEASFGMDDHAYGSIFYLMTGFHGLHVLGGLALMAAVAWVIGVATVAPVAPAATPTGVADPGQHQASLARLEACSYYWHFVDAVWLAMFATIYLLR